MDKNCKRTDYLSWDEYGVEGGRGLDKDDFLFYT